MNNNLNNINFHIVTFGCQMNKHDSERIYGLLESLGANYIDNINDSDIVIYMTCCVREAADTRLYGQVSSIKNIPLRQNSPINKRIIAVGGCIGQRDGNKLIDKVNNINIVFGTHNIANLPNLIFECINNQSNQVEILDKSSEFSCSLPTHREDFWAAWVPITTGCNNFCSYCIVPYVRGREKSRDIEDILTEIKNYKLNGVKEVTLLGQNVNSYGRDLYGQPRFYDLLCRVDELNIPRIRFTTSHPKDLSDDVISCFGKLKNLMPALHLPVQSGSNKVLKSMNRHYSVEHYLNLIDKLKIANPNIALSTDIIVGFPNETQADFDATYNLVEKVQYHQVFSFIYSKRAGTPAAKMENCSTKDEIQSRFNKLLEVIANGAYKQNKKEMNKSIDVLFTGVSKKDKNVLVGKSPKNQTVHVPLSENNNVDDFIGKIKKVKINDTKTWYLNGSFYCE